MILKFEEYIELNEGVEAKVSVSEFLKTLGKFGWTFTYRNPNAAFERTGPDGHHYTVTGHLKHGKATLTSRIIDVNTLDCVRSYIMKIYDQTGDPDEINSIDWKRWHLPNPFEKEYKAKPVKPETESVGKRLMRIKQEKALKQANDQYKDAGLMKIDFTDTNSAFIMMITNERGRTIYNTCRSEEDRRPILKNWSEDYKKIDGVYYFSKEDMRDISIRYYKVNNDGTLDKVEKRELRESKNIDL